MTAKILIGVSAAVLVVLAALFIYEIWFCSSALHGDATGCAAMTGANLAHEPLRLIAVAMSVAGILVGLKMARRR